MRRNSFQFRLLRAALGTVLALHLGLAQASMVNMLAAPVQAPAPCHDAMTMQNVAMPGMEMPGTAMSDMDATSAPVAAAEDATHAGTSHTTCCAGGDCHCAAVCALDFSVHPRLIGVTEHTLTPTFLARAVAMAIAARQLRPPIRH